MTEQGMLTGTVVDCSKLTTREINQQLRTLATAGLEQVMLTNPAGRHNLAVGMDTRMKIQIAGPVGYYCGGLSEQIHLEIDGNCGWSVGENLMAGQILIRGSASANAAATARGGTICILGHAGPRAGISLKGATVIIKGNVGPSSAFMMQQGRMIICGDAGANLADSIYQGEIFVGGRVASLGADARYEPMSDQDWQMLAQELGPFGLDAHAYDFKKIVCAEQLYHFKPRDFSKWKDAY
ncbi:MAG: protein glxC [Elainella sp. C42_A2020_010]|nr:protein glxC [Elainella sp. C42_A2020_010]